MPALRQQACVFVQQAPPVVAPIHKVTHEDVIGGGHLSASLKQAQQVMELAMDVTADLHACVYGARPGLPVSANSCMDAADSMPLPWLGHHTVTGAFTGCTLDSSTRISLTCEQEIAPKVRSETTLFARHNPCACPAWLLQTRRVHAGMLPDPRIRTAP